MRRLHFPGDDFWTPAEKLTYYILFPALLIHGLSQAHLPGQESMKLVLAVLLLLIVVGLACYLVQLLIKLDNRKFTSFFQGSTRFNTFVALAITSAQLGVEGLAFAAVIASVMIPTLNIMCVLVFAKHGEVRPSLYKVLRNLLTNPLILGSIVGLLMNVLGGLPSFMQPLFLLLSQMALPLGLLSVGAALNLAALRRGGQGLIYSLFIKLMLFPVIAWMLSMALGLSALAFSTLFIFATVPTATSAYILARQLGGDAEQMAAIITAQTLFSMLTIPVWLALVI